MNNLQWKRCSEMVTIGTLKDSDNLNTIKEKCADAFHLSVPTEQLVLVRAGAKIDDSAFTSLGEFLSCLSAQQQSKISFGIGLRFVFLWFRYIHIWFILFWYIIHQEDEVSPSPSALSRSARPSSEHGRNTSPISSYHSRESSRHSHSHSRKTTRPSVENKRSTSPLSAYDSREPQQSEVSRRSRSRSRSPCASSGGTCQTAGKDLFLELNHNC